MSGEKRMRAPSVGMLEDDPNIVRLVRPALEGAGLSLRVAESLGGFDALSAAEIPDLFILDVNLPDGTGFEACRRLRAAPATAHVPVIFLTSRDEVENRLRAFEVGAQDYVIKPFAVEELLVRVQAHLKLKIRHDQKEAVLAELAMRERLQTDLMDMVIHDVRTPISTVKLTLGILAEEGSIDQKQYQNLLTVAGGAADAALLMLNDLLDLRTGKVSVEKAAFAIDQPLRRAADILAASAARHGISIDVSTSPPDCRVVSDEKMLLRVILNLLGNAVKFTAKNTVIELSLAWARERLRLEVRDRGPGVPAADKERIFLKFHRAGAAALSAPGTGIGLSFCRLAADTLGGRVWVEDRPGGGSVFVFEISTSLDESAREAAAQLSPEILSEYLSDCRVQLSSVEMALAACARPDAQLLESVRRTAHRLAGSAGTYGFAQAGEAARRLELRIVESRGRDPESAPSVEEISLRLREIRHGLNL